mmetsp:Transcript_21248/g.46892  ORF Transcript_21248/g.46892 Transcript_21248/m.46892 type:complete len:160 (+) Transcript_21248:105-584(+)
MVFPRSGGCLPSLYASLLLACLCSVARGYVEPRKFLLASNARNGTIYYGQISNNGSVPHMKVLVKEGLEHPQGIAVDQKRSLLLVADSGLRKVVSYGLSLNGDTMSVDEQTSVADDADVRWVAVDGTGNVLFTDELRQKNLRGFGSARLGGQHHGERPL